MGRVCKSQETQIFERSSMSRFICKAVNAVGLIVRELSRLTKCLQKLSTLRGSPEGNAELGSLFCERREAVASEKCDAAVIVH